MQFNLEIVDKKDRICDKHQCHFTSMLIVRYDNTRSWTDCPECKNEKELEKHRLDHIQEQNDCKQRLIARLFKQSAIPPRFIDNNFENYIADIAEQKKAKTTMLQFANNITNNLKSGRNVILAGNPGNGKTHLSVATAKAAINAGHTALFTTVSEMIDRINEAGWNKATTIDNYTVPDLLILDEISTHFNSEEQKNLFKVLNSRYEQIKSTIIQTNSSMDTLKEMLGERIIDRLRQNNCIVLYFSWESYRR